VRNWQFLNISSEASELLFLYCFILITQLIQCAHILTKFFYYFPIIFYGWQIFKHRKIAISYMPCLETWSVPCFVVPKLQESEVQEEKRYGRLKVGKDH